MAVLAKLARLLVHEEFREALCWRPIMMTSFCNYRM